MMTRSTARIILCAFVLLAITRSVPAGEAEFGYPPTVTLEEVRQWIDRASKEHPRLLADESDLTRLRESIDQDPLRRTVADAVIRQARWLQDARPIARTLQGRRLLGESRRCVKRVVTLAMAYQLTGDAAFANRCEKEMLAVARFRDWNPSHFLDVAEMAFALALGYDWLYEHMNEDSRSEIRRALIEKAIILPLETRHRGWVKSHNNWGQVCHGGVTAAALAVMEDEPDLAARTVHNALHHVTNSMAAYAPNGSYPEGPGYWSYGTSYNVLLIGVLESALGSDFGLIRAPGFSETGQYPNLACGPSGQFFNYADGGAGRGPQAALFWFASRFERPDWLMGERELLRSSLAGLSARDAASGGGRLLPLVLLWLDPEKQDVAIRMPLNWNSEGDTPVTIHRTSWTDPNATFVGLKGGSPSGNHGQMDIGSFVLDADGVRWAMDLGAEGYHGIESRGMNLWSRGQDSDRWTIFRQSNEGHNTLVIDGQLQRAAAHGAFIRFSDDPAAPLSVLDMSPVYQGQAQSVHRGVTLFPSGEVLLRDELTGLKPGSRVRWGMITPATHQTTDGSSLELRRNEASLELAIVEPRAASWRILDTVTPKNEWDSPNRGTCMAAFEIVAPPSGKLNLTVLATPGSCSKSMRSKMELRPLSEW